MRDGVLLLAGVVDVRAQQLGVQQIDYPEPSAFHFVLICGADAARGGADLHAARSILRGELNHAVVRQDDMGAI